MSWVSFGARHASIMHAHTTCARRRGSRLTFKQVPLSGIRRITVADALHILPLAPQRVRASCAPNKRGLSQLHCLTVSPFPLAAPVAPVRLARVRAGAVHGLSPSDRHSHSSSTNAELPTCNKHPCYQQNHHPGRRRSRRRGHRRLPVLGAGGWSEGRGGGPRRRGLITRPSGEPRWANATLESVGVDARLDVSAVV